MRGKLQRITRKSLSTIPHLVLTGLNIGSGRHSIWANIYSSATTEWVCSFNLATFFQVAAASPRWAREIQVPGSTGRITAVSEASGNNWVNTWFETHSFQNVLRYTVPPMDLLIYYGNKEGAAMTVEDIPDGPSGQGPMKKTRYAWTGDVSPGQRLQFVQVLFPHVRVGDETTLAQGIRILLDQPGTAAVLINTNAGIELASLNSAGGSLTFNAAEFGRLTTDARACYVKIVAGTLVSVMAEDATYLSFNDQLLLQSATRTNYETTP